MVWVQRHRASRREKARVGQNSEPIVKIDRTDEWPKFDQRTNLFGLCLGSVLSHEKFSRTHVVHRPRPRTPAFFPLQIAFYKFLSFSFSLRTFFLLFFFTHGALGFFLTPWPAICRYGRGGQDAGSAKERLRGGGGERKKDARHRAASRKGSDANGTIIEWMRRVREKLG